MTHGARLEKCWEAVETVAEVGEKPRRAESEGSGPQKGSRQS
jgi:hypothetical protein